MKYVSLCLLLFVVGCSRSSTNATVPLPVPPPVTVSITPSPSPVAVSQALPELSKQEVIGEVDSTNDLIDSFYFDGDGIKVSLNVASPKACYIYVRRSTPDKTGEIEMESLSQERAGLWRGYQTGRVLTQGAGNKLNVYQNDELLTSYENSSISPEQEQAIKDLNERKKASSLLLRQDLYISQSAKRVYANQCQTLKSFYFKEELSPLSEKEQLEFERSIKDIKEE